MLDARDTLFARMACSTVFPQDSTAVSGRTEAHVCTMIVHSIARLAMSIRILLRTCWKEQGPRAYLWPPSRRGNIHTHGARGVRATIPTPPSTERAVRLAETPLISSPFPPFAIVQPLSSVVVRLLDHPVCCRPLGPRFSHDSNMHHTNVTEGVRRLC